MKKKETNKDGEKSDWERHSLRERRRLIKKRERDS